MKTLFAYLELARPLNGIIAFISAWLGGMFASQGRMENLANIQLLRVSIAAFVLLSAGNAINDYCDYEIDRINRPRRPLPSGRIRRRDALIFAILLVVIGIWLGTLINRNATGFAILVSIALASYAFWLKRMPFIGNLVVSGLTGVTFVAGGSRNRFSASDVDSSNLRVPVYDSTGNRQRPRRCRRGSEK